MASNPKKDSIMFISPYEKTGGLVWFARMVEKIRMRERGELPSDYQSYMGIGFDGRCVRFLGVDYEQLVAKVLEGGSDDAILQWCFSIGNKPTEEQILVWNEYMMKRGWRDSDNDGKEFQEYKAQYGLGDRDDILTFFDFHDVDEGRKA